MTEIILLKTRQEISKLRLYVLCSLIRMRQNIRIYLRCTITDIRKISDDRYIICSKKITM